ncbi:MAG: hypothetical protein EOO73_10325 [Myxococcales bacterium]|nr:MAG: hypothetical protein EOO73_10325 [Myxococcales bacterium]
MKKATTFALALVAPLTLAVAAPSALANPHPLPFSYPYQTLPKGKIEVEEIADLIPMRVAREKEDGTRDAVTSLRSRLQTELELGITDRLELGLYFQFQQGASADTPAMRFDGMKQRLRYRFAEEGDLPVDIGVYFEVAEFHNEVEIEEKLLLSRRFGYLTAVANLWVEQEYYFQAQEWKLLYNPTAGMHYELSPNFMLGLEYWARGRFDDAKAPTSNAQTSDTPTGARHFLGPTVLLQSGEAWWSTGVYARLDHLGDALKPEDPYGKVWIRTMIGFGF